MDAKIVEEGTNSTSEKDHPPSLVSTECSSLPEMNQGGWDDPKVHFGREFVRFWPFRLLKTAIWLLLLIITVLAIVSMNYEYRMNWSSCWAFVSAIYSQYEQWHQSDTMVVMAGILLLMATLSKFINWLGHRAHRNPATKTNPSLLRMAEWKGDSDREYYWDWDYDGRLLTTTPRPSTTPSPYAIREMEGRRDAILMHLLLDPTISLLALLAILTNLANVCAIRAAIRRTKCWVANYGQMHPQCSELDAAYAQFFPFGLLKLAHWFLPTFFFFFSVLSDNDGPTFLIFGPIAIVCFLRWLSYLGKVRFHPAGMEEDKSTIQQLHKLAQACKMDCVLSLVGILGHLLLMFNSMGYRQHAIRAVSLFAAFLFLCSFCLTFRLLYRYGGPNGQVGFGLNVPSISVNISIKVVKLREEMEEGAGGGGSVKEKPKEEAGSMKE